MNVKIKRRQTRESAPYWQTFSYDGERHVSVATLLEELNAREELCDTEGKRTEKIEWECSCLQGMCGGCAMVINGVPRLACTTFLDTLGKGDVVLEPLSKFPTVCDLAVDRSVIYDSLLAVGAYPDGEAEDLTSDRAHRYSLAKCLKCGLCLEVCPNYHPGAAFFGAVLANESHLLYTQEKKSRPRVVGEYQSHFAAGCSKSLSCQSVCPAKIETLTSVLAMNRGKKK